MYDTEEDVKRKRRKLKIIIGVIIFLIILLIIFLLTKDTIFSKKKASDLTCTLEVKNGILPNSNGVYTEKIEVGFREINSSENYDIVKKAIGTTDNSNNLETYQITNSGTYKLYGFVEDKEGNKTTCELNVVVSMTVPTCELEIKNGTLGENSWYKSDVEVGFKSMETNNSTLNIAKYYIVRDVNSVPKNNIEKLTITDNGEIELKGIIVDSSGGIGSCELTVKKDTTAPTCTLSINGTKNESGEYTDNPVISFATFKDDVSQITTKGIGTSKNYTNESFTISNTGKTTVYGYVKDSAGNEGSCSVEVTKATPVQPTPTPTPTPKSTPEVKKSSPTCSLDVAFTTGSKTNNTINSSSNVLVNIIPKTTNGATIVEYSFSADGGKTYVKNPTKYYTMIPVSNASTRNFEYVRAFTTNGTYYVKGYVKESYGNTGHCPAVVGGESVLTINVRK